MGRTGTHISATTSTTPSRGGRNSGERCAARTRNISIVLFRRVRSYTQAATYQANDNPMEAILLSIALDQEKRLDARPSAPRSRGRGARLCLR